MTAARVSSPAAAPGADEDGYVVLRPLAGPLPLGFFSFAVGMALLGAIGLGLLSTPPEVRTAGVLMAAFVFPLELVAAVVAMLSRDTAAATTLGLFATSWLGLGLLDVLNPAQQTDRTIGVFLATFALMLVPLGVMAALGKQLMALVLTFSILRAATAAAYQLGAAHWTELANGATAFAVVALACYAGTAFLVEDLRGRTPLVPRRGAAAAAVPGGSRPRDPGVRRQL